MFLMHHIEEIFLLLQQNLGEETTMRKVLMIFAVAIWAAVSAQAQKIQVVNSNGQGIPLVSVLDEEGHLIGTTDMDGVLANVKGAQKVSVTHVAYQPQVVSIASLKDGRVVMEDLDYSLSEVVVKPKPYIYVQTYYRAYGFINDTLRYYVAGLMPNAYDIKKKKIETGSKYNSCGEFYPSFGVSITWGARVLALDPGKVYPSMAKSLQSGGKASEKYYLTLTDEGNGRQRISNAEGTVGYLDTQNGQVRTTLDGGKVQMYANKVNGEEKMLKRREEKQYAYQYTDIHNLDEDGNAGYTDMVMNTHQWEWDGRKGRDKLIIEAYTVDRGYMDKEEWKAKKKELKKAYGSGMTLDELESYAASRHLPALAPSMRAAIEGLKKKK